MAKSLFIFLFFSFFFGLIIYKKYRKVLHHKHRIVIVTQIGCNVTVTVSYHMTKSHEEYEKVVV